MAGLVFFSWISSYWEDIVFWISASVMTIIENGNPKFLSFSEMYSLFPIYKWNLIYKTTMNVLGWVIVGLFYGDFCDHIDYMNEYANATREDLKVVKELQCIQYPEKFSCRDKVEEEEQEIVLDEQAAEGDAEESWFDEEWFFEEDVVE